MNTCHVISYHLQAQFHSLKQKKEQTNLQTKLSLRKSKKYENKEQRKTKTKINRISVSFYKPYEFWYVK